jgi:flagellar protein FliS
MYSSSGKNSYATISLDSQIAGATPHQLICMLFDGAINAMRRAEIYFQVGNIARRGEMISRAINIIDNGLRAGLNHDIGGVVSADLERLYEYVSRSLLEASIDRSAQKLPELITLMVDLAETWKAIEPQAREVSHAK